MLSLRTTFPRRCFLAQPHTQRQRLVRFASQGGKPGPNEGIGEKKPAATNDEGPVEKRAKGVKEAVGSAAETVKKAMGATKETTDGAGGTGKAALKPSDSQNQEEAKKGKAAGGTFRDH